MATEATQAAPAPALPALAPPTFFARRKREIGGILGIAVCLFVWFLMPAMAGLSPQGRHCLALSLMAVV